ncbi:hypothetical protein SARC_05412 [Sphaeroforma arctica JP610]|uniref:Uncharacterized protein n=1 Tax=Sphaeroforma arctica JP610 TaxID=667725 RepID=A0A0L0G273_9EUKA|nr:hypothetical protein SARC_05412 [Sphaeroforma arctica JP610]KNC82293.1 hypothetical protein SARC_05412 [Sphaeroforma arctica JP610]|eukprot:XP_014156195.1 hypothetical protein SARC_05412 [Sphaeroforma arctica JP610]
MSPGNAREPNPSMYRTSNTFARHTPRASPSVFQHPAPVHRSTHYAQRTHSISPGPPTHIQTHNHADGQRHTGVPAVGRGQGIGGVGGHNGGSHYSNGGSPLPHMGGYSPGLYAEGHRDRVDPDSQSGAENSRKAVKLTPRGTNVYVMHSTANSSSNTPVERSGGYTQTPTSAHAYAGTTTYRHPTSHTQAHRRSVGEGSDYGSVGRASGGNHGNQHGANGGGSHAHRSTDDTEHDPEHEREGGRDSEHEADVLYTLGAMEENTNVLGARPVLDTEREVDITFLGASSSVGVSASMHIERVAVPVWGGVGVDSVESVTAAVAESTMEAVVRDSTVEIGYASTSPVMESSRHLEETEASAGQSSSMPDISRDGGSHTHVVHTSHSETMVVEESSDGEGSVSMYDGVPMAPASPPSGKRLSVTESGAGEPEGPSTGGTDGSSKTSERGEGEGVGTCTGDVSDDTRLGGMATRQGDVSDGGAQQTRNGGQPSTLEHKNYLNAQGVHDGTRHSPRLLRGPREGQARGAKDTHTSPLLGAKSTPESPRLTAKNAPKSPRLIAKNTPKNPRLIAKNTPKSPRPAINRQKHSHKPPINRQKHSQKPPISCQNTPKSPRLTTKTTPKDPRLTAKNTPKGPTVPAKNTQSISLAVTRNTPKPSALQRKSPRKTPRSLHDSFAVADTSVGVQGATNLKGYPKTESAANSSRKLTDWIIKPYDDVYEDGFCVEGTTVPGNVYWHR